jgi:hypothetical protein
MILIGQNTKDNECTKEAIDLITQFGYDRWIKGDTKPDDEKKKA